MQVINLSICSTHRRTGRFLEQIVTRLAVLRTRRALSGLDQRALDDIGITAAQATEEAEKGVWDMPASWAKR